MYIHHHQQHCQRSISTIQVQLAWVWPKTHSYVLANWDPIENFDFISPLSFRVCFLSRWFQFVTNDKIFIPVKPWDLIGFISFLFICVFYPHKLSKIHQFGNVAQRNWESINAKKHENTAPHNHWKKSWAMVVFMRVLSERPPYTQKRNHHRLFTFCLLHDLSLLPGGHIYWSCLIMSPLKGWPVWCSYTYLPGKCWGHIPECIFFVTQ